MPENLVSNYLELSLHCTCIYFPRHAQTFPGKDLGYLEFNPTTRQLPRP